MNLEKPSSIASLLALISISAVPLARAVITTTVGGVYDEQTTRLNTVDKSFSTSPSAFSGTGPAPTLLNVGVGPGTFSTLVAAAYLANQGGVMNFDDVASQAGVFHTQIDAKYGAGSAQTLSITGSSSYSIDMSQISAVAATPISGGIYLRLGNPVLTFNFSTGLQSLGFTVLGRSAARNINLTLTYNDGTTASYADYNVGASGSTSFSDTSANDTFFGFEAPTGLAITKMTFNTGSNNNNPVLDDFGFIIPEPSAILLSGLAGLAFLRRRKR